MPLFFLLWTAGVAIQLTQARLWATEHYGLVVIVAAIALVLVGRLRWRRKKRSPWLWGAVLLAASAATGFATTGWRATHYLGGAISPSLEARPLMLTGTVVGLPMRDSEGQRFLLAVESLHALPGKTRQHRRGGIATVDPSGTV